MTHNNLPHYNKFLESVHTMSKSVLNDSSEKRVIELTPNIMRHLSDILTMDDHPDVMLRVHADLPADAPVEKNMMVKLCTVGSEQCCVVLPGGAHTHIPTFVISSAFRLEVTDRARSVFLQAHKLYVSMETERLKTLAANFLQPSTFTVGSLVMWKKGMRTNEAALLRYDEPAVVLDTNSDSMLAVGVLDADGDFVDLDVDARRLTSYDSDGQRLDWI